MFIVGVLFSYFVVIPYGFDFLINFSSSIKTVPNISFYISFLLKNYYSFWYCFSVACCYIFLVKLHILNDEHLKKFFKYGVVLIFVFSSIITPPDVITQLLMAIPMIFLYIVSIFIAKSINPYIK